MDTTTDVAVGFLSYSHSDDEADNGRIRRLAEKIQAEYKVLTGEDLKLFVDRTDIGWGEKWRERIDGALQTTTFFIPVLSPSFFASEECRREFFEFYNTARSLGVLSYLLAIRYTEIDDLVGESSDEAKSIAAATQYKNWTGLRLEDENGSTHRQAVNDLAQELVRLVRQVQAQPAQDAAVARYGDKQRDLVPKSATGELSTIEDFDPYGDTPTAIELLAELPARTDAWTSTMRGLGEAVDSFNGPIVAGTADLHVADGASNPFAAKLIVLRRVADELDEPSKEVENMGAQYMKALLDLDPSFRALAELGHAQTIVSDTDREALASAKRAVRTMIDAGRDAVEKVQSAIDSGRSLARTSRDLRPALKRYETGSRNIIDGQRIMEQWGEELESVNWPEQAELPST
ncbi:toll/interleukin-1 receptor domain-containing protein [Clavibacter michiganensis]|uniref:toll/interleukin-1 receptor domain-containing protein n=1 Tax=Clavibacter michiganensis TaxID=28447 RepID=UPI0026DC49EC|nr:toll/interleukin-1 receptor domain-containing protein [Clavibacter michiganensis]MDO4027559.1 toll/interleukin-1 receptor domain-containing protein [Clavibacter michiganensis]